MKTRFKTIVAYSLLILFLGYYGSITLFYHAHIVLGETIVHSHPYKTSSHGIPLHSHTNKGYLTIQILSCLAVIVLFTDFSFKTVAPIAYDIIFKIKQGAVNHTFQFLYSLRAPPSGMLNYI